MPESIRHEWRVSEAGDLDIVRIFDHGDGATLTETLIHIPGIALRYAIANATGTGDGYGRGGKIEDDAQEPQEAPQTPGAITEPRD